MPGLATNRIPSALALLSTPALFAGTANISRAASYRTLSSVTSFVTVADHRPHLSTRFTPGSAHRVPSTCPNWQQSRHFRQTCPATRSTDMDDPPLAYRATTDILADHLERPSLDNRTYRVIRLPNKLEALLIHDPDTDKASAALDNNAGSFSDDKDLPGMAHAVEHLLFMGTEKYPKENEYNQYLTAHSGYSNAFTASTSTNYFFEISVLSEPNEGDNKPNGVSSDESASPLYGALDRFAQFFIAPLFLEETLDRELKAVDSENKKNLQSDTWRLHQLAKSLSNPDHPFCRFSTGNLQTLRDGPLSRGIKIREEFMRFHKEQYSANRMKLVVLGRESLDQLQSWVEELFADVKNKNLPQNRWDGAVPFTQKELRTQVFAQPVMDTRTLEITFPINDEEHLYESQPSGYLSHLIGHEGPGSILAYIKAKGWANGLSAGSMSICPGSEGMFSVSVSLTPEGLKNYKEVTKVVFQYISILHETPPQEWIFEEIKGIAMVDFKFKQKSPASSTTSGLSQKMQKPLPREALLRGTSLVTKFDASAIKKATSYLRAENVQLTVISQDPLPGKVQKEQWYGTEYTIDEIPPKFIEELTKAETSAAGQRPAELYLPARNEFIPTRLDVEKKEVSEPLKNPKIIRNDQHVRLWYKKDDQFWVPKANMQITLRNPVFKSSPRTLVLAVVYTSLVDDALEEFSYNAEIAGLDYGLSSNSVGTHVTVSGYNDKMAVLLEKVLTTLRDVEIKDDRFEIIKERFIRYYKNFELSSPYQQIGWVTRYLAVENGWMNEHLLAELEGISADDVRAFRPLILHQLHIEAMVHGNVYREDALKLADLVENILKPQTLPAAHWPVSRSLLLPDSANYLFERPLKDPSNVNHCIEYLIQVGERNDRDLQARLLVFAQMTDEPAFNQLRTKEQLGYIVFSGATNHLTTSVYHVLVQSERSPDYLEGRINSFLRGFKEVLANMSPKEFESHKRSVINKRLEKIKNLNSECNRFWGHISSEFYRFDEVDQDVTHIRPLTKDDLLHFYAQHIDPDSPTRSKLSIHLLAQSTPADVAANKTPEELKTALADAVAKLLTGSGLVADAAKLDERLSAVDIAAGDQAGITAALLGYVQESARVPADQLQAVEQQLQMALGQILPTLGISTAPKLVEHDENAQVAQKDKEPTVIKDVRAWKASLRVGTGAAPVRDLAVYEDFEPKL